MIEQGLATANRKKNTGALPTRETTNTRDSPLKQGENLFLWVKQGNDEIIADQNQITIIHNSI